MGDIVFGALYAAEGTAREALEAVAREFSPRIEVFAARPSTSAQGVPSNVEGREITVDLSGLTRLFGDARTIAEELRRTAADRGLRVRVAIAATRGAARLLVRHRAGITIAEPGTEAAMLAPLPLSLLDVLQIPHPPPSRETTLPALRRGLASAGQSQNPNPNAEIRNPTLQSPVTETLRHWGLRTLGELAALAPDEVAARLGQDGVEWQRLARGEDPRPLVPTLPEERFEQALDLEWPIEGLEPLSFVLGRLMEPLEAHLARRDRGAAVLHVRLHLIKAGSVTRPVHARSLQLPAPMRDARALRTLALLDLESHPPDAPIERVAVAVDPTPGRIVQFSLLTRALPSPERLSTLMARLSALMGEDRCGSPVPVDTWRPGALAMKPFLPATAPSHLRTLAPSHLKFVALRRFRAPVPARVRVEDGAPVRVAIDRRGFGGGRVETAAGPWRTSGAWWRDDAWERDEWDVTLSGGATYRVFRVRETDAWFVDGVVD